MGEGFTVDPDRLREYAGKVDAMIGAIGEGRDAAEHIMTTNSVDVGTDTTREQLLTRAGLPDSGRLDKAYGLICQPAGMVLEDWQQKLADTIGHAMGLMTMLADGLRDCATRYTEDEMRNTGLLSDAAGDYDDGLIPVPNRDTSVVVPHDDPGPLPEMTRIPQVRGNG